MDQLKPKLQSNLKKIEVYSFNLGDVSDPEIYAGHQLYECEKSEMGQYCMTNCLEAPTYEIYPSYTSYGYKVSILARFTDEQLTYFNLKYK